MKKISCKEMKNIYGGRVFYFIKGYVNEKLIIDERIDSGLEAQKEISRLEKEGYKIVVNKFVI